MSQYEKLREHIKHQTDLVLNKLIKSKNHKEITNIQIEWISYQVCSNEVNHEFRERSELLVEALTKLTADQMTIYRMKFSEGKSNEEIGEFFGHKEWWTRQQLKKIYDTIRNWINYSQKSMM